jgi:alkylation response protein AidB-like acyl-CoA dehydrogenase
LDFAFSEEQQMLREQARSFLADKFSPERIAELADSDEGWDEKSWREMAELGWVGLSAPEAAGGAGMTFIDEAVLFEQLGYGLYPGPYFSTVALALPALERSEELLSRVISGEAAATLAWAEEGGPLRLADAASVSTGTADSTISGDKQLVPDLNSASLIVVVAREGLFAVEASDATVQVVSTMDTTRRFGRVSLANAPATQLAEGDEAAGILETIRLRALAALSLEAVGVAQRALEMARDYASDRKQFDKPIGTYQAVSHEVANAFVETELARSLAYWAAWCVAEQEQASLAAAAAKSFAAEAAVTACEQCIQVHGGMGFTWEHVIHRYYKRAQWIQSFDGYGATHRAKVAEALLA